MFGNETKIANIVSLNEEIIYAYKRENNQHKKETPSSNL